jgi:hypothetical protein
LDSVVLDDAVATQDTVTQLIAAVRRVRRDVPGAAALIAQECHAHDWDDPGKPRIAWNDKAARDALVSALVNDAALIVDTLHHSADDASEEDGGEDVENLDPKAAQALALLALVAGQDVEPADGSDGTDGRWRIARKVAEDRTISTVDVDARHVHKSVAHRQDGYKAHLAVEPDTGLITAAELTKACGEDNHEAVVGLALLDDDIAADPDAGSEPGPFEVLADAAYGTGEARAALAEAGHTAIIKPPPLRPAVEGGFTLDDFTVDEPAGTVTCPNGVTRRITAGRKIIFGVACRGCPLRQQCTTGKNGRKLSLHPHDGLLRQARRDWTDREDLRTAYRRHRPMVERSIAWLIGPKGRCRQLRYRGIAANDLWLHHRIAALNLRRLLNLGLHHNGTWNLEAT